MWESRVRERKHMEKEMEKEKDRRERGKKKEEKTPPPRVEERRELVKKKKSLYLEECAQEVHNTEHFWRVWWERTPLSPAPVFSRALLWIAAGRLHMLALGEPVAILDGT